MNASLSEFKIASLVQYLRLHPWMERSLLSNLSYSKAAGIIGALMFAIAVYRWILAIRIFGVPLALRLSSRVLRMAKRSVQLPILLAVIVSVAGMAVNAISPGALPPFPPELVLGYAAVIASNLSVPPIALMLGSSRPENDNLYESLIRSFFPYRIAHLLAPGLSMGSGFELSSLRTSRDWKVAVDELMDMVQVVILDVRILTPAVLYETNRVVSSPSLSIKTVFIADLWRMDPLVAMVLQKAQVRTLAVSPENAVKYVKTLRQRLGE